LTPTIAESPLAVKLAELGWTGGQNILFERRLTKKRDELARLASELVSARVDVIVAAGTPAALAAKAATSTIPIVMVWVGDPVRDGLVASLARPGGNVTGASFLGSTLFAKRLDILKEAAPGTSRVAILRDATNQAHMTSDDGEVRSVARHLNVTLQYIDIRGAADVPGAIAAAVRDRADGLMLASLAVLSLEDVRIIAEAAKRHRMVTIAPRRDYVDAGMLISYQTNFPNELKRAAVYVDKILKGARPADLPVEQPATFELIVNLKTARAIGLTIPPSLLVRADEVIQ
jgi:putative ABC transport system substrate-binding protein